MIAVSQRPPDCLRLVSGSLVHSSTAASLRDDGLERPIRIDNICLAGHLVSKHQAGGGLSSSGMIVISAGSNANGSPRCDGLNSTACCLDLTAHQTQAVIGGCPIPRSGCLHGHASNADVRRLALTQRSKSCFAAAQLMRTIPWRDASWTS